jgi:hypothetical protein
MKSIKINDESFFGKSINIPFDGEVKLDENGVVSVSDEAAEQLIEGTSDWTLVTKTIKKKPVIEEVEETEEDETVVEEENEELTETEEEEVVSLDSLSVEELIQICEEANFPKSEWGKYTKSKKALEKYIAKKQS